ncbi:hypothetical protein GF358_02930 [Candidatus Woesearchaeota archaeon]|nr:hypothetical protein [Candidatus Woesearchaeota archaeon]
MSEVISAYSIILSRYISGIKEEIALHNDGSRFGEKINAEYYLDLAKKTLALMPDSDGIEIEIDRAEEEIKRTFHQSQ